MKTLYVINGAMGVGKTAVSRALQHLLPDCAFVDGDACWDIAPFRVTEVRKKLVFSNAAYLLNAYLACEEVQNCVFCWVMQRREIVETLLRKLSFEGVRLVRVTLTAREETLRARIEGDIAAGRRTADVLSRALAYLPLFEEETGAVKVPTDSRTVNELARAIADMGGGNAAEGAANDET